jgi:hypothetical protein
VRVNHFPTTVLLLREKVRDNCSGNLSSYCEA